MNASLSFSDRLATEIRKKKNAVCVGLDPQWNQLPVVIRRRVQEVGQHPSVAYRRFCFDIIDVVAPLVPIVKPQMAFFEQLGPMGMKALYEVIRYAREKGLLVLLDGKRGDIGSTAEAYAAAYLGAGDASPWGADALTVHPYLGTEGLQPFVDRCLSVQAGIFVLVRTSNPGSAYLQAADSDPISVAQRVADWIETTNQSIDDSGTYGPIGAVVGATYPEELAALRQRMPHAWLLVPGYGAQGGTAADVLPAFDQDGLGAIVNNSRAIIYAYQKRPELSPERWQQAVQDATTQMIGELSPSYRVVEQRR